MEERMTKREMKEARRAERANMSSGGGSSMKWIIIAIGSAIFLALFAFVVILIKQSKNKPVELVSSGWVRGNPDAAVTLVEFGDFQCPACRAAEPMVRQALKDFDGKMKLEFKHFPLTGIHPNAELAAHAAEAAGLQGKFWEMHDFLYDNQDSWAALAKAEATDVMTKAAQDLKLDVEKFKKDLGNSELAAKVSSMQNEGINIGVNATPTFFINNKKVQPNPSNYEDLKNAINAVISGNK